MTATIARLILAMLILPATGAVFLLAFVVVLARSSGQGPPGVGDVAVLWVIVYTFIAGYWILQVKSKEEAVEWAKRVPFEEGHVELRRIFELEDFAPGEAIETHQRLRDEIAKK